MTFKHKLSRRLAQLFASLAPAVLVTACERPIPITAPSRQGPPVASVVVTPDTASVVVSATIKLTAIAEDSSGAPLNGRTVTWATSSGAIATVDSSGLVRGIGPGLTDISATVEGKKAKGSITVRNTPVASVSVSPATASVQTGQSAQLTATPRDANGTPLSGRVITWTSGNTGIATVSTAGLVNGVGVGSVTITATSEGQSGMASVAVVNVPVASVTVSPATASIQTGQSAQFTASPKDANGNPLPGRAITWTSGNTAIATVSTVGLVNGVGVGSVTITATSEGQSGMASVAVVNVPVMSVTVSPATASIQTGQSTQLTASPKDANGNPLSGRAITWTSSNTAIATVSGSGLVIGVLVGTVTITATSEGKSGTASVGVTAVPVASVAVSPATASVQTGQSVQLVATPKDANGTPLSGRVVTWASSSTTVATVSGGGLVSGNAPGNATVTATSEGKSGTAAISVTTSSGFAPPDILGNASFEAGDAPDVWDGFTDWTGTPGRFPYAIGSGFAVARTPAAAYVGTYSVGVVYAATPSTSATIEMVSPSFAGQTHFFYRFYFLIAPGSTEPTQSHKWVRTLYTLVGCDGGLYLDSPGGDLSWANVESNPGNSHTPLKSWGSITQGVWHYIEVEYDRSSWNVLPGVRARFWYDGSPLVGGVTQLQATSFWGDANGRANPTNGNGDPNYPYLYANGTAAAAHPVTYIDFDDTWNQGNTGVGGIYYDRVAVSTQRIGP